jgi:hypothetical protein
MRADGLDPVSGSAREISRKSTTSWSTTSAKIASFESKYV